jgi:hypothetical protein
MGTPVIWSIYFFWNDCQEHNRFQTDGYLSDGCPTCCYIMGASASLPINCRMIAKKQADGINLMVVQLVVVQAD